MSEIGEIMNMDPSKLTPADVDQIVAFYRELVHDKKIHPERFKKNGLPKKIRDRKAQSQPDPAQLDLEDLIKETK